MKADVHNKEAEASQKDLKGVPQQVIMSSNMKEDTNMKIKGTMVNSNARV